MSRARLFGVVVVGVIVVSGPAIADTIRLRNGSAIEVEAWRDAGDAIEFSAGGGIVRIPKSDVDRVEGQATRSDLRMYSAPPAPAAAPAERASTLKQMAELLRQGEGLAAQTVLAAAEKAGAFRRLGEAWQALGVPDELREVHARGRQALQLAAEAFAAEGPGATPDAKERVEKAKAELQGAQDELKKAGGPQG